MSNILGRLKRLEAQSGADEPVYRMVWQDDGPGGAERADREAAELEAQGFRVITLGWMPPEELDE